MARFDIWTRRRFEKESKIATVDTFDGPTDRKVRRALRENGVVLIIDTLANADPGARYTVLDGGTADPFIDGDGAA